MSLRPRTIAALAAALALALPLAPIAKDFTPRAFAQDEVTRDIMLKLIDELWSAPSDKVKSQASGIVNRAIPKKANMLEVRYAHGLLMLHKEEIDAATSIFKKITKDSPNQPLGWLALAHAQIVDDKADAAIASLTKAIQIDPKYLPTIQSVASLVTFYSEKPPTKLKVGKLSELEQSIYPKLPPELQSKYKAAQQKTKDYLGSIEKLRKERLASVADAKKEMLDLQKEIRKAEAEKHKIESALQAMAETLNRLRAESALRMNNFESSLANARSRNDNSAVQQILNTKANVYSQYQAEYVGLETNYKRKEFELSRVNSDIDTTNKQLKKAERTVVETERRVDRELSQPPMPLMPDKERERIRKGDPLDPYQASKEPLSSSGESSDGKKAGTPGKPDAKGAEKADKKMDDKGSDETPPKEDAKDKPAEKKSGNKGKQLLSQAEMLHKAGRLEAATERYKKIIKDYPDTEWADAAKEALQEIEAGKGKPKR